MNPFYQTVGQLSKVEKIPSEYIPACHLIYSAPATLSYNSPGAIGFGVKRAGLVIPESVMLLVSPASCGRNSTILSQEEGYAERMFYLLMSETDLVTGRHLRKLRKAVEEIIEVCEARPAQPSPGVGPPVSIQRTPPKPIFKISSSSGSSSSSRK